MSLILDALNRSRSEQGAVPNLETVHGEPGATGTPARSWLPWLALAIALTIIAWLLLDRAEPPTPATAPVVKSPQPVPEPVAASQEKTQAPAVAPEQSVVQESVPPPTVEAPAKADTSPEVAALYSEAPTGGTETTQVKEPTPDPDAGTLSPRPTPEPSTPSVPAESVVEEQAVDIERMISQAEDELDNARLEEHSAPFLASLSQVVKDSIPTLLYERHDYSGRPGQSRVVLNGQSLAEGGRTKGVVVQEILPDSVVLEFQGTSFRLRALNSWINL